jgi:hypothetical protein
MNERIQTLLTKFKETESTHRGAHVLMGLDEIEKFAELLAKELANHIAGQLPNERLDDWHEGYHAGVQRSIDCLKEFGVQ